MVEQVIANIEKGKWEKFLINFTFLGSDLLLLTSVWVNSKH